MVRSGRKYGTGFLYFAHTSLLPAQSSTGSSNMVKCSPSISTFRMVHDAISSTKAFPLFSTPQSGRTCSSSQLLKGTFSSTEHFKAISVRARVCGGACVCELLSLWNWKFLDSKSQIWSPVSRRWIIKKLMKKNLTGRRQKSKLIFFVLFPLSISIPSLVLFL